MVTADRYEVQILRLSGAERTRYREIQVLEPASHTTQEILSQNEDYEQDEEEEMDNSNKDDVQVVQDAQRNRQNQADKANSYLGGYNQISQHLMGGAGSDPRLGQGMHGKKKLLDSGSIGQAQMLQEATDEDLAFEQTMEGTALASGASELSSSIMLSGQQNQASSGHLMPVNPQSEQAASGADQGLLEAKKEIFQDEANQVHDHSSPTSLQQNSISNPQIALPSLIDQQNAAMGQYQQNKNIISEDEATYKQQIVRDAQAQIAQELGEQGSDEAAVDSNDSPNRRRDKKRRRKMVKKTIQEEYISEKNIEIVVRDNENLNEYTAHVAFPETYLAKLIDWVQKKRYTLTEDALEDHVTLRVDIFTFALKLRKLSEDQEA